MQYRVRETGEVKTQGEIRRIYSSTSFPRVWGQNTCDFIGIDPVLLSPKPEVTELEHVLIDGVEKDSLGNWVEKWIIADKFSEYTDEDDVIHTKLDQETKHLQGLEDVKFVALRAERTRLLEETDFLGNSDVTMSDEMTIYRQALRDLPKTVTDINNITYPEKPL